MRRPFQRGLKVSGWFWFVAVERGEEGLDVLFVVEVGVIIVNREVVVV